MNMPILATEDLTIVRDTEVANENSSENGAAGCDERFKLDECAVSTSVPAARSSPVGREYLCYFLHRLLSFRQAEVQALAERCGAEDVRWRGPAGGHFMSPFWYVRLQNDEIAREIASRSMLIRGFYELWGEGGTFEELVTSLKRFKVEKHGSIRDSSKSWKIVVDSWGRTMKLSEQVELIDRLEFLGFEGPISLSHPDVTYRLIITSSEGVEGVPDNFTPRRYYFGREVAISNRKVITRYALPKRRYIGPTSMDTEMAFVICNMAGVRKGHLVYDPFVGTGSILVAAAHLGAHTLGADIDVRVVRDGKLSASGEVLDNWTNFRQYGLTPPVGLLRSDAHFPPFRECVGGFLDAIACDPPYGVRAGGRRSVSLSENGRPSKASHRRGLVDEEEWVPPTTSYSLSACLQDLLAFAARHLRLGGRLVYFLPAVPNSCQGRNVPQHPTLCFVSNCEQVLTGRYSRRLVTMEKIKHYDPSDPVSAIDPEIEGNLSRIHETVFNMQSEEPQRPKFRSKLF